jgi:hypothetical protein
MAKLTQDEWVAKHPKMIEQDQLRDKFNQDKRDLEREVTGGLYSIQRYMTGHETLMEKVCDLQREVSEDIEKELIEHTTNGSESWYFTHQANSNEFKNLALIKCAQVLEAKAKLDKLLENPPWKNFWEIKQQLEKEYQESQTKIKKSTPKKK